MTKISKTLVCGLVAAAAFAAPAAGQNLLGNGSFETPGIGFDPFTVWGEFNNVFADDSVEVTPQDGIRSMKSFGQFLGTCTQSDNGVFQTTPVTPGTSYTASVWALSLASDLLTPNDFGVDCKIGEFRGHLPLLILNFKDSGGAVVGAAEVNVFDPTTDPADTWIQSSVTATAPATAVEVEVLCLLIQFDDSSGSLFWDNVSFEADGPTPCSPADLAAPFGQLDFFDVLEFLSIFDAGCP